MDAKNSVNLWEKLQLHEMKLSKAGSCFSSFVMEQTPLSFSDNHF